MFRPIFQGIIIRNDPAFRPRPATITGYYKFSNGDFDAFVKLSALEAIANKARQAAPNEMIGHLVGRPFRDAKGPYIVVTEAIFAESARSGPVTVETTLDDERRLLATLEADHPLAERLGWFHSHPFYMPTYSSTDLENQRFWSEVYHLGLLACLDRSGGVSIFAFRGPEAEPIRPAFATFCSSNSNRVTTFIPEIEQRKTNLKAVDPTERTPQNRFSFALLTLAMAIIWPVVYIIGVWMTIQAIREGQDRAVRTTTIARESSASTAGFDHAIPIQPPSFSASKLGSLSKSIGQTSQEHQRPRTDSR